MVFVLEILKVWADVVVGIAWPFITLVAIRVFAQPIKDAISRIKSADFSGGGARLFFESFQRVAEKKATNEEKERVRFQSAVSSGVNANGSYTLYSNLTVVVRLEALLKPNSSSHHFNFPIEMVNEVTSVQIVGDVAAEVVSLDRCGMKIKFAPASVDRSIKVVVAGL
jgi:non-canonical (house-cleaning) NTP pyrophosphatase